MFTWLLISRPVFQRQSLVDNSEKHRHHAKHPEEISCEIFCAQSPLICKPTLSLQNEGVRVWALCTGCNAYISSQGGNIVARNRH